jgi:hypothetical protein
MSWHDDTMTNVSLLSGWAYSALRPIVRILRAAGVSQSVILDGVKHACTQHAADKPSGRLGSGTRYQSMLALAAVTSAWARSAQWTDESGNALELSLRGEDAKSFSRLVLAVSPRLNPATALKELQLMDVARVVANGAGVRLVSHAVAQAAEETFAIEPVLRDLQRFAETLEHNVFCSRRAEDGRMQQTVARLSLDPAKFADFARFAARNGQLFLESAEDRLRAARGIEDGAGAGFGVGIFVFLENPEARPIDTAPISK